VISGRVQGVGFRWFVLREAQKLGVAGWVRNLPDGRVEVFACGSDDAMSALEGKLFRGPRLAVVDRVEKHTDPDDIGPCNTFEIK
jgi:acylphosphatase